MKKTKKKKDHTHKFAAAIGLFKKIIAEGPESVSEKLKILGCRLHHPQSQSFIFSNLTLSSSCLLHLKEGSEGPKSVQHNYSLKMNSNKALLLVLFLILLSSGGLAQCRATLTVPKCDRSLCNEACQRNFPSSKGYCPKATLCCCLYKSSSIVDEPH